MRNSSQGREKNLVSTKLQKRSWLSPVRKLKSPVNTSRRIGSPGFVMQENRRTSKFSPRRRGSIGITFEVLEQKEPLGDYVDEREDLLADLAKQRRDHQVCAASLPALYFHLPFSLSSLHSSSPHFLSLCLFLFPSPSVHPSARPSVCLSPTLLLFSNIVYRSTLSHRQPC